MQECFEDLKYEPGQFPVSEWASKAVVSIPIFGEMRGDEQQEVIDTIREFYS